MVKNVEKSVVNNAMNVGGSDADSSKEKRSQDGNPLDPMTAPYYSSDLAGRSQMFGASLGRIRAGNKTGANIAEAALSGLSLGMGLTRNIMGASSEAYAASRDEQAAREKLAENRRQQFIRWEREGGGINLGNGQRIDTSDMTGEYIYPLPKSMEDNANVEIEKENMFRLRMMLALWRQKVAGMKTAALLLIYPKLILFQITVLSMMILPLT